MFSESAHSIGAIVCAAPDARIIRELGPDLFIFANGAFYEGEPEHLRHPSAELVQQTAEFADVLIIGAPILGAVNPSSELEKRLLAVKH